MASGPDEYCVERSGLCQAAGRIDGTVLKFIYSQNIMTGRAKHPNRRGVAALIRQETHPSALSRTERQNGLMSDRIGGVLQCSAYVVRAQSGVCVE